MDEELFAMIMAYVKEMADRGDDKAKMLHDLLGDELMAVGVVERLLLERKDKHAYFLWGHIKAKCIVDDEIELGQATYKDWCGGDSKAHKNSLTLLSDLKAIRVTWGKKGGSKREATLVKRLM